MNKMRNENRRRFSINISKTLQSIIVSYKNKRIKNSLYLIRIKVKKVDQKLPKITREKQESALTRVMVVLNLGRNQVKEKGKGVNKIPIC